MNHEKRISHTHSSTLPVGIAYSQSLPIGGWSEPVGIATFPIACHLWAGLICWAARLGYSAWLGYSTGATRISLAERFSEQCKEWRCVTYDDSPIWGPYATDKWLYDFFQNFKPSTTPPRPPSTRKAPAKSTSAKYAKFTIEVQQPRNIVIIAWSPGSLWEEGGLPLYLEPGIGTNWTKYSSKS
jgi:hypothetical protein